ncbi:hypothetical protein F1188_16185 [Roseospira marina]|uniref:Uncharacterized protein n=1 Tax=Roseospira marina TaxID=140057 RepID=A0A5M6I9P5_9PROT|nr:hypothetical protein [Roseospira marina]KAA5604398.1 hypothetical protein F1188_16185 [Roseospira marina]MBB4315411.1 hypothetical protein [Roseospira marina]MBB5088444.1 hypothetical protein [Roseospira marina]
MTSYAEVLSTRKLIEKIRVKLAKNPNATVTNIVTRENQYDDYIRIGIGFKDGDAFNCIGARVGACVNWSELLTKAADELVNARLLPEDHKMAQWIGPEVEQVLMTWINKVIRPDILRGLGIEIDTEIADAAPESDLTAAHPAWGLW